MQLALVGSMAHDDPEGWEYYNRTVEAAGGDPDIFILSNLNNVGSVEVNAFQVHSAAVLQKSIREGFGLTVTEALWKGRPIVAGRVGGIVDQIQDGETGYLVDSVEECAEAVHRDPRAIPSDARAMALSGKEYVRGNFLTPRLLRDWLALFNRPRRATTPTGAELVGRAARLTSRSAARGTVAGWPTGGSSSSSRTAARSTFSRDASGTRVARRGRRRPRHGASEPRRRTTTSRGSRAR